VRLLLLLLVVVVVVVVVDGSRIYSGIIVLCILSLNCLDSTWEDEKDSVLIGSRHCMN